MRPVLFLLLCVAPLAPALVAPANGARVPTRTPLLDWSDVSGATSYTLQLRETNKQGPRLVNTAVAASDYTAPRLKKNTPYVWRIRACHELYCSPRTRWWSFTTP